MSPKKKSSSSKTPRKDDKVLITWDKVKCLALALAVEHQKVSRKKDPNSTIPNWKAVTDIINEVFTQEDAEFRKSFPDGLPNANKLRSEFSDRYRGRHSNKWHTKREQCTPEEIEAMEHIASVVFDVERRLAGVAGSGIQAPGPDVLTWVSYDVRPKSTADEDSASKDKGKQRAVSSGSEGSGERGSSGSSQEGGSDDDVDEPATGSSASQRPAAPKRAWKHLASASSRGQGGESSAMAVAAAARRSQEGEDDDEEEEVEYQTIILGPRLTDRVRVSKKVRFASEEKTGITQAETAASSPHSTGQSINPGMQTGAPPASSSQSSGQPLTAGSPLVSGTGVINPPPTQPAPQMPVSAPASVFGEGITDPDHAAKVNIELNRRYTTRPQVSSVPHGLPFVRAAPSALPPQYIGDGITEVQPQPIQYHWEVLKRHLLIAMQARRWPEVWQVIKECPAIDLASWKYDRDLVGPLSARTGVVRQMVDNAVCQALHRYSTSSRTLQHLLCLPNRFPHCNNDAQPNDTLRMVCETLINSPQLHMIHTSAIEFRHGQACYIVREFLETKDPVSGLNIRNPVTGDKVGIERTIHQRDDFVHADQMLYQLAGEVRRVLFGDMMTGQSLQVDVMLCDEMLCDRCTPGALIPWPLPDHVQKRVQFPLLHQKDIVMLEDTTLMFAPREQSPPFGAVIVDESEAFRPVHFHGTKPLQAVFCDRLICTACFNVPCPVSLEFRLPAPVEEPGVQQQPGFQQPQPPFL